MSARERVSELLRSLVPRDSGDSTLLERVFSSAEAFRKRGELSLWDSKSDILKDIPQDAQRYFHGLVEALDIYCSIHGKPLSLAPFSPTDSRVQEIKKIRDLCLDEGLHSLY